MITAIVTDLSLIFHKAFSSYCGRMQNIKICSIVTYLYASSSRVVQNVIRRETIGRTVDF